MPLTMQEVFDKGAAGLIVTRLQSLTEVGVVDRDARC